MANEDQKLQESLLSEAGKAEATQRGSRQAIGVSGAPTERFKVRTIRAGKRAVAEQELKSFDRNSKELSGQLLFESGLVGTEKQAAFEQAFAQRFNEIKLNLIKRGANLDKKLTIEGMDREKRRRLIKGVFNFFKAGASAVASGGTSGPSQQPATSTPSGAGSSAQAQSTPSLDAARGGPGR